jgi:hypothetical protein
MKVCGFTIVRNAVKYDYPVVESIKSILPVCDKFVVAIGNSTDETRKLIETIGDPKIEIIDTIWDDSLRTGGAVLAVETNKAFDAIGAEYDWCFYIQADEVVHEQYHDAIRSGMQKYLTNKKVEGLLFHYTHFYGNYKYVGNTRQWYRHEIRIIRNLKNIRSYRDAQGFRIDGRKLNVKLIDASIFHYGWVKNPRFLKEKEKDFHKLWHSDEWIKENVKDELLFDLYNIDSLGLYTGTHPEVMKARITDLDWDFDYDTRKVKLGTKKYILHLIEKYTGKRLFEYRNYWLI